jgi:hypothetical protein
MIAPDVFFITLHHGTIASSAKYAPPAPESGAVTVSATGPPESRLRSPVLQLPQCVVQFWPPTHVTAIPACPFRPFRLSDSFRRPRRKQGLLLGQ